MERLQFTYGQATHIGRVREENQDGCGVFPKEQTSAPDEHLFIVADGMGGHVGGREASAMAVDVIGSTYFASAAEPARRLQQAFAAANARIRTRAQQESHLHNMGTTASALLLRDGCATIAHVGDSRIYRISESAEQLTTDHSEVEELVRRGILTREQAETHPRRHVLTRGLGLIGEVEVDAEGPFPLHPQTSFVLCTDGLAKLSLAEIEEIVRSRSPQEACQQLVQIANERGGQDNVTVQVVRIDAVPEENACAPPRRQSRSLATSLAGLLLLALIALVVWLVL